MAADYVRGLWLKVDTAQLLPFFKMLNCYEITNKQTLERKHMGTYKTNRNQAYKHVLAHSVQLSEVFGHRKDILSLDSD